MDRFLSALRSAALLAVVAGFVGLAVQGEAVAKDGGTLTIARAADSESLDPKLATTAMSLWVYTNIYDTLVEDDQQLKPRPGLATSWDQISPTTMRFHLRQGVKFHDGTPFNADAVKFTFDRALDKNSPARGLSVAGPISDVKVVDDYTVDISTSQPYGPMLKSVSLTMVFGIVSPTAVKKYGAEFGRNPVGTGPFSFASWQANSAITLNRNAEYWGGAPHIDKLVFKVIPEANSQVLAFGAGEIDGIASPDANLIARLKSDDTANVDQVPGLRMLYVGFNTQRPVFSDVRVRRAFNHAVNTQAIANQVMRGNAVSAKGYLPEPVFGFFDAGTYKYDPAEAKRLLSEAGWKLGSDGKLQKDGQPLSVNFWGYTGRDPNSRLIAEAIQGELAKIGVSVNLRIWDYPQLSSAIWQEHPKTGPATTAYDMYMLGWTTITGDPDFTLYGTVSDISIPPEGLNANFWAPPEYMEQLKKGRFSTNPNDRIAAYKSAQQMLHDAAIWIPLIVLKQTAVFKKQVTGFSMHPVEFYMLKMKDVSLSK
jgi:peptide/nickel transport system substrate-binding protein